MPKPRHQRLIDERLKKDREQAEEQMMIKVRREALKRLRELERGGKPELWAPGELWPGESTDLGGFLLT